MTAILDTVHLLLPADCLLPVPERRWRRRADSRVEAEYTLEELGWALACTRHWAAGLRALERAEEERIVTKLRKRF